VSEFDNMSVAELQGYYSDFHKAIFNVRPRYHTTEQWYNIEWLKHEINSLHDHMDKMKATPAGRAQLESEGWQFED
jgi:hypothetical protein